MDNTARVIINVGALTIVGGLIAMCMAIVLTI